MIKFINFEKIHSYVEKKPKTQPLSSSSVPPTSSSKCLIEDPVSCTIVPKNIIKNSRNYVENIRKWQNSVSNYLPLYQRLVSDK